MKEKAENHCADADFLWVHLSETASSEYDGGRFASAAKQWRKAYEIAHGFEEHDPRIASSLNNVAIALRTDCNFREAEQWYGRALEHWETASQWVNGMHLSQRARSSLFHLRMEQKHRSQYKRIALERYNKLLHAGLASTLNNLGELFCVTGRPKTAAKELYVKALGERLGTMGERDSGVVIIRKNIARLSDRRITDPDQTSISSQGPDKTSLFASHAALRGWIVGKPAQFTDEGRLMAAVLLSYLIDHSRLHADFRSNPELTGNGEKR